MRGLSVLLLLVLGCGGGDTGTVSVTAFGQVEARMGISSEQTADGFSVRFDHVVLELQDFVATTMRGEDAQLAADPVLIELVPSSAVAFSFEGVTARRWDEVGYTSAPPPADVGLANDVDAEIVQRMIDEGWSQFISGTLISEDGMEYPFEFGFPVVARYRTCRSGRDGTFGFVTPINGTAEVEITWHLTHLFFDSFAEDSALRVEPFAAVFDGDPITVDDLRAQPLADIRDLDGDPLLDDLGNPVLFIPPPGGAETLREHMLSARFGHFDGLEGFCMGEVTLLD
ncbi:MAG: hypothetical protein AAGE52_30030 [Myxococcota bacterium]